MNKLSSILLGAAVAFATIGAAHAAAPVAGSWKLSTGVADAPCVVTLTPGVSDTTGTATSTGDCNGTNVGRWHVTGSSLELSADNGTLVALLSSKGDAYEGSRIRDGRKVALNH